ncbi:hypothetical protein AAB109_28965 (plasmid) [Priestia megaterium]|uniref:glycosyltransferase n=1 Tax=Priestia megaterium TaxID=1404 RepID=UPI002ACD6D55|nr:hypothetical protein [Priestia megaterium]
MPKVLIISYFFPPLGSSQRALKFVKFLSHFGWEPFVIAPKTSNYLRRDFTMEKEIPTQCRVIRLPFSEKLPGNPLVTEEDFKSGWYEGAIEEGLKIIKEENIDIIYTSSAPYISHIVGKELKDKTNVPWIADFLDEWTTNPFIINNHPEEIMDFNQRLEKEVLNSADGIISVCDTITDTLFQLSEQNSKHKFHTIMNGYDSDDFCSIITNEVNEKFRLCYMGSLYGMINTLAEEFFQHLERFILQKKIPKNEIELLMVGDSYKKDKLNISRHTGYVAHQTAINYASTADLLLLFIHPGQGNQTVTSKLYELINLKKPILGIVPPYGEAADIIRKTRTGIVVDSRHPEKAISCLMWYFNNWKIGKNTITPNLEEIEKHDRKKQTEHLVTIMNSIKK